ncbi:uncharacterized protein JN550_003024 [Neoarthrinium moseri]|uniref:uncharacterized protein n=1 Tax=Neoarthrinium moseri TaxID=1658444 RepID=UPI001FDDE113|nr:uncharacterized protein JN550_003024 [Neoarthrinium moseri]KAI1873755.1 hypothetical protein JN550_003024 [Neoarthrinium moseri]
MATRFFANADGASSSPFNLSMPGGLIKITGAAAISIDKHGAFHLSGNEVQWDGRGSTTVEKPILQERMQVMPWISSNDTKSTGRGFTTVTQRRLGCRSARIVPEGPVTYAPRISVRNDGVRTQLVQIARIFVRKKPTRFHPIFRDDEEYLWYLQEGYEVLYWDVIMDIFHNLRVDLLGDTHAEMMMNTIRSTLVFVTAKQHSLLQTGYLAGSSCTDDLGLLIDAIDRRTRFLARILRANSPDPADLDLILSIITTTKCKLDEDLDAGPQEEPMRLSSKESTWYWIFALFIASILGAFIPGSIGFAKNWFIVSTFGNLAMLMLFERSELASPYRSVWITVAIGTICNIVSVIVYPQFMKGWSAIFALIGTVFSASCVVITTYTAALERRKEEKPKKD